MVMNVGCPPVGVAAAVTDPHPAAGAEDRIESRHHAAGRSDAFDAAVGPVSVRKRLAIGDDDELVTLQTALDEILQRVSGPHDKPLAR